MFPGALRTAVLLLFLAATAAARTSTKGQEQQEGDITFDLLQEPAKPDPVEDAIVLDLFRESVEDDSVKADSVEDGPANSDHVEDDPTNSHPAEDDISLDPSGPEVDDPVKADAVLPAEIQEVSPAAGSPDLDTTAASNGEDQSYKGGNHDQLGYKGGNHDQNGYKGGNHDQLGYKGHKHDKGSHYGHRVKTHAKDHHDSQSKKDKAHHDRQSKKDKAHDDSQSKKDKAHDDSQSKKDKAHHDSQSKKDKAHHDSQSKKDKAHHDKHVEAHMDRRSHHYSSRSHHNKSHKDKGHKDAYRKEEILHAKKHFDHCEDKKHYELHGNKKHFDHRGDKKHYELLSNKKHFDHRGDKKHLDHHGNKKIHFDRCGDKKNHLDHRDVKKPINKHDDKRQSFKYSVTSIKSHKSIHNKRGSLSKRDVTSSDAEASDETSGTSGEARSTRGKTSGTSGEARSTRGKTSGTSVEARSTRGKASGTSGEARSTQGKTSGTSGEARSTRGKTSGTSGEARSTRGKTSGTSGEARSTENKIHFKRKTRSVRPIKGGKEKLKAKSGKVHSVSPKYKSLRSVEAKFHRVKDSKERLKKAQQNKADKIAKWRTTQKNKARMKKYRQRNVRDTKHISKSKFTKTPKKKIGRKGRGKDYQTRSADLGHKQRGKTLKKVRKNKPVKDTKKTKLSHSSKKISRRYSQKEKLRKGSGDIFQTLERRRGKKLYKSRLRAAHWEIREQDEKKLPILTKDKNNRDVLVTVNTKMSHRGSGGSQRQEGHRGKQRKHISLKSSHLRSERENEVSHSQHMRLLRKEAAVTKIKKKKSIKNLTRHWKTSKSTIRRNRRHLEKSKKNNDIQSASIKSQKNPKRKRSNDERKFSDKSKAFQRNGRRKRYLTNQELPRNNQGEKTGGQRTVRHNLRKGKVRENDVNIDTKREGRSETQNRRDHKARKNTANNLLSGKFLQPRQHARKKSYRRKEVKNRSFLRQETRSKRTRRQEARNKSYQPNMRINTRMELNINKSRPRKGVSRPRSFHHRKHRALQHPLRGHDIPLRGHDIPLRGHDKPLRGHDKHLRGHDKPLRGHDKPLRGHDIPLRGHNKPLRGNDKPLWGNDKPLWGHDRPLRGLDKYQRIKRSQPQLNKFQKNDFYEGSKSKDLRYKTFSAGGRKMRSLLHSKSSNSPVYAEDQRGRQKHLRYVKPANARRFKTRDVTRLQRRQQQKKDSAAATSRMKKWPQKSKRAEKSLVLRRNRRSHNSPTKNSPLRKRTENKWNILHEKTRMKNTIRKNNEPIRNYKRSQKLSKSSSIRTCQKLSNKTEYKECHLNPKESQRKAVKGKMGSVERKLFRRFLNTLSRVCQLIEKCLLDNYQLKRLTENEMSHSRKTKLHQRKHVKDNPKRGVRSKMRPSTYIKISKHRVNDRYKSSSPGKNIDTRDQTNWPKHKKYKQKESRRSKGQRFVASNKRRQQWE